MMAGKGTRGGPPGACPVMHDAGRADAAASAEAAAAPAAAKGGKARGPVYNVYGQEIDPTNMMPAPNQAPSMGCNIKWKPGNNPDY